MTTNRRMGTGLTVLGLATLGLGALAGYASPYYSLYQLERAYEAQAGAQVAAALDYDALVPSVSQQLSVQLQSTLDRYPAIQALAGDGLTQMASVYLQGAVRQAFTPANVAALVETQTLTQETQALAASWVVASGQVDLQQLVQTLILERGDVQSVAQAQLTQLLPANTQPVSTADYGYCGLNCFEINVRIYDQPVTVLMSRKHWVQWQITDLRLPV